MEFLVDLFINRDIAGAESDRAMISVHGTQAFTQNSKDKQR